MRPRELGVLPAIQRLRLLRIAAPDSCLTDRSAQDEPTQCPETSRRYRRAVDTYRIYDGRISSVPSECSEDPVGGLDPDVGMRIVVPGLHQSRMSFSSVLRLVWAPRLIFSVVMSANHRSTMLNHVSDVGMKCG